MSAFPEPGGSCLVCYRFEDGPHGYLREFDQATDLIKAQLQQMYGNGQRRLGICVPYYLGGDTFALDSTDGTLQPQDRANLTGLIQLAVSLGFLEFLIEMIPEWSASYANWTNPAVMQSEGTRVFQPLDYGRDFAFTVDVWNTAKAAAPGVEMRMDLIGEGADPEVCARMWNDWCDQMGGSAGSVGFSMLPTQDSIDNYPKFYTNGIDPEVLSVHAYNNPLNMMDWPTWKQNTAQWPQAYIIGESLCNSPDADAIFAASPDRMFYRLAWPKTSNDVTVTQNCLTVNQRF